MSKDLDEITDIPNTSIINDKKKIHKFVSWTKAFSRYEFTDDKLFEKLVQNRIKSRPMKIFNYMTTEKIFKLHPVAIAS